MKRGTTTGTGRPEGDAARTPWLVLAASLAFTIAMTLFVNTTARQRDDARFRNVIQATNDRIAGRLDVYVATLRGAAALFAADREVDADQFHAYVERLDLKRWYPGIQGIGWTVRLAYEPDSAIDERHAIRYLEPLDERNLAALGYDMYSEAVRRRAMAAARDQGAPALSGRVRLVQEIFGPEQAGFLIYMPVYEGDEIPADTASRRRLLRGFVYSPFRADDLFDGIFGTEREPRVSFRVYDGTTVAETTLLHDSPAAPEHRARFTSRSVLTILDRTWTVDHASAPAFEAGSGRFAVPLVLLAGLVGSAWLFSLARGQARARMAAEAANRAKSDFLAMMSHELRTPLNAISGYAELIQIGVAGPTTAQQVQYLERIQRAQHHLLGLINNILTFAKIEARKTAFDLQPLAVRGAVAEAEGMIAAQALARDLKLVNDGGPDAVVVADADKLRQILLNLLSNAVKFTDPGGTVRVGWNVLDGVVRIHVADTGDGVPPQQRHRIFEPFVQVDSDLTRLRQGTGLGLSIARELARGMNGEIDVSSEPGRGSTFVVSLPLQAPQPG